MTPYAAAVLDAVDRIPPGRVASYSDVAELVGAGTGRTVGTVLSRWGAEVPWHRVLRADGSCAPVTRERQLRLLQAESVPMIGDRVDMRRARWDGRPA
jgi:alkylated DNA nucleotide flippase Atl1